MTTATFHLLPNAHLDPVWLWDWREGMNEGIITTRTVLDLMDEFPDLTFMRGEAALYQHIEEHDPVTFRRVKRMIEAGRWDVVGGTWVQPDTNLPATETFLRHFALGQAYFASRFGIRPRVAWAADSFGHSAGLPEILAAAGMEGFSFSRPAQNLVPLAQTAFWWEGPGGSRILTYRVPPCGWYGMERDEMPRKLDATLEFARRSDLRNVGVYVGLGNHGGGPTRRHILDVYAWAKAHPEVEVRFSTLHRLLDAVRAEVRAKGEDFLPVHRGELNFCLRGCYASQLGFKTLYRQAEALVNRAERVDALVSARIGRKPADLRSAWEAVLFNSFHDILPGSSIERAYDEQREWLGGALHAARGVEHTALNALTARLDTRVVMPGGDLPGPVVMAVFNPHPHEYRGPLELEASLDYRPIWPYYNRVAELPVEVRGPDGKPLRHQSLATEHSSLTAMPWRWRVVVPAVVPPLGWSVFEMQWKEGARKPKSPAPVRAEGHTITNGTYTVTAEKGAAGVRILRRGKPVFGKAGLHAITVDDPWGSWGNMEELPAAMNLSDVRHAWTVTQVDVLERGPERATLWVRLEGGASRLDLSFSLCSRRAAVDVSVRLFWNERSARLKLVMPVGATGAEYEVPGGTGRRGACGEVPGGRWVRTRGAKFGFASDALYCFDLTRGALRATLVRASRYANDIKTAPEAELWRPATDVGEHRFRFVLTPGGSELPRLAAELEMPPVAVTAAPHPGDLPRTGSLAALTPETFRLLAIKPAQDGQGWILRVQETAGKGGRPELVWLGRKVKLDAVEAHRIASWRLRKKGGRWQAERASAQENANSNRFP
jgi:alpha-mannosidase